MVVLFLSIPSGTVQAGVASFMKINCLPVDANNSVKWTLQRNRSRSGVELKWG